MNSRHIKQANKVSKWHRTLRTSSCYWKLFFLSYFENRVWYFNDLEWYWYYQDGWNNKNLVISLQNYFCERSNNGWKVAENSSNGMCLELIILQHGKNYDDFPVYYLITYLMDFHTSGDQNVLKFHHRNDSEVALVMVPISNWIPTKIMWTSTWTS
jgi:hypothetical protein